MAINFNELLKPYGENGRTIEGQIRWLRKKGIPPLVVEKSMSDIYRGLDAGQVYADGHGLDQALLGRAIELLDDETRILMERLEKVEIPGGRLKKAWLALRGKI